MVAPGEQQYYDDAFSTLGERIGVAREQAGLSREEVARSLAVMDKTVGAWEDDTAEPRANKLTTLAGVLGVSPSWLLKGVGDGVPAPDATSEETLDNNALRLRLCQELRQTQETQVLLNRRIQRIVDALEAVA